MPSTHQQGRQLEYAVRRRLKTHGYVVFRCAGSRPIDLIAMKGGTILLIECKTGLNPHLSSKQMNYILDISKKVRAIPLLVVRRKYRGMRWFQIKEGGVEESTLEVLISLLEYYEEEG
jgi:Holliday junction resolvase